MPNIFTLLVTMLVISVLTSLDVLAEIPTDSIDFWIGSISPRCAINIIYHNLTNDFIFKSTHGIPVMLIPLTYYNKSVSGMYYQKSPRNIYLKNHIFHNNSLRFQKAECYFSVIYYKLSPSVINTPADDSDTLLNWINYIAYGFGYPRKHDSNLTYCLILYHGTESNDRDSTFKTLMKFPMEMSLALIYLSKNSKIGYNVYCKTPSSKLQIAARNVVNEVASIVDQKFMTICSNQYTFAVLNEHNSVGVYDPLRSVIEYQTITQMFLKANISIEFQKSPLTRAFPRVIVWDFDLEMGPMTFFLLFDNSIRFFTCYSPPVLSFHFYVSAFKKNVWISVVLCGILLATFMKFHIYFNLSKTLNFSTLLFYFSIFMEETYNIPSVLGKNKVYRTATILWLLSAIVLTNTYTSHVISGLNAPLTGEPIQNNDLYGNFSTNPEVELKYLTKYFRLLHQLQRNPSLFFTDHINSILEELNLTQPWTDGYRILSEPLKLQFPEDLWLHIRNPFIYSGFYDNLMQSDLCYTNFIPPNSLLCRTLSNLMNTSNKYYPAAQTYKRFWNSSDYPRGAVEEELVKCQRSVYMERSNQLEFKYMSENYKSKRLYYLQDRFTSTQIKWGFYNLRKSKLPFYFSMFLQSGIYHELHKLKLFRDHQTRRSSEIIDRTHKPDILDMTSSVQTIFILFLAMTVLAKFSFFLECSYFTYKTFSYLHYKRKITKLVVAVKLKLYCRRC